jgi:hypothetical protein
MSDCSWWKHRYRHLPQCETVILGYEYVRIQAALSSLVQCPQMVQTQPPR